MNIFYETLVDKVIDHNSSDFNTVCCIEEMSELTKVLTKKLRNSPKFTKDSLLEEISHVKLMCDVIATEHGLTKKDIFKEQQKAVSRMGENK